MKKFISELLGTYIMVFFGTGAIVINDISGGSIGHIGISISFGLAVCVVIYAFVHISGAHINPAVSIAFSFTDRYEKKNLPVYILGQCLGAILASSTLLLMFGDHPNLGATLPMGSWEQSFILEIILTFVLMLIILLVSQNDKVKNYIAPAVGGIVLLEALVAGPISGASMNPARSLGPALVSGEINSLWIYLVAPIIGGILASYCWRALDK